MALIIDAPDHPIESVTIYSSSRAEVVRQFSLQLVVGQNKIEIKSLPGTIDTQSIRISGLGHARLHDVVCLLNQRKRPGPTDHSEVIKELRKERGLLDAERRALEQQSHILSDYSGTLKGEHVSPADVVTFLKSFGEHKKSTIQQAAKLEERIQEVGRDILKQEDAASLRQGPKSNGELTVVLAAQVEENVDLKLTYIVYNASWQPTYELHATTENVKPSSTVVLNYRALISQRTGEDWTDAKLTLSTSNTSMNTTIPALPSIKIRRKPQVTKAPVISRPRLAVFGSRLGHAERAVACSAERRSAAESYEGVTEEFAESTQILDVEASLDEKAAHALAGTVVRDSALSVSYSVQGEATIPSDGFSHMVTISELEFDSQIKYVAVPRVESVVYLQCEVKNTSEYRLLPGTVGVILDGSFVSQTSIWYVPDVPAGDTFTCTLGVDPATKITYSRRATHSDTKRSAFSEARRTTSYTVSVSITNKHGFTLEDLLVKEALPMVDVSDPFAAGTSSSDNSKAKVLLKKPLGLAEGKPDEAFTLDGSKVDAETPVSAGMLTRWAKAEPGGQTGDKDGKFEWFGRLDQGEKIELEAAWDIKSAEDVQRKEVNV